MTEYEPAVLALRDQVGAACDEVAAYIASHHDNEGYVVSLAGDAPGPIIGALVADMALMHGEEYRAGHEWGCLHVQASPVVPVVWAASDGRWLCWRCSSLEVDWTGQQCDNCEADATEGRWFLRHITARHIPDPATGRHRFTGPLAAVGRLCPTCVEANNT